MEQSAVPSIGHQLQVSHPSNFTLLLNSSPAGVCQSSNAMALCQSPMIKTPYLSPPTFAGDNIKVDTFLEHFEEVGILNGWNPTLMLRYLPASLQGWAKTVYKNTVQNNPNITWADIKIRFQTVFNTSYAASERRLQEMLQRFQGPLEPVLKYYSEKLDLINKVGMNFSEGEVCRFIVLGLAPDIVGTLVMREAETSSLRGLEKVLLNYQDAKTLMELQTKRQQALMGPVHVPLMQVASHQEYINQIEDLRHKVDELKVSGQQRNEPHVLRSPQWRTGRDYPYQRQQSRDRSNGRYHNRSSNNNQWSRDRSNGRYNNNYHQNTYSHNSGDHQGGSRANKYDRGRRAAPEGCYVCGNTAHTARHCPGRYQKNVRSAPQKGGAMK